MTETMTAIAAIEISAPWVLVMARDYSTLHGPLSRTTGGHANGAEASEQNLGERVFCKASRVPKGLVGTSALGRQVG